METILDKDWIECGDYLEYDNMVWLYLNSYSFHKLYCRAIFMSCDWKIYWIDENSKLQSQYVIDQNSTQYNSGETGNSTITLGSAQHMLKMQCNDNTILLDSPIRFAIDKNTKKPTCYKITQNDNSAYNYGKGLCCITVTETPLNTNTDKLITLNDGTQVWVCDYIEPSSPLPPTPPIPNETTDLLAVISGNKNLRNSYKRTYTVNFTDKDGNSVDWQEVNYHWSVISDFEVKQTINGNNITVSVNDEKLIGNSLLLQIVAASKIAAEIKVNIVE